MRFWVMLTSPIVKMAKKWTTLRKVNPPPGDDSDDSDNTEADSSRTPRRRRQARKKPVSEKKEEVDTGYQLSPIINPRRRRSSSPDLAPQASEPEPEPAPPRPIEIEEPRILVVHDAAATYRLVEEAFSNFTKAKVDSTPDVLTGFEMAIRRDYQLFIIGLTLPGMTGHLFYEMVARGYASGLGTKKLAPAVVYIRESDEALPSGELDQDVRVKAIWTKPLNIERMLDSVSTVIKRTQA